MEAKSDKKTFVFSESKSYEKFFKAYMSWCKEKGYKPLTKDANIITLYLTDLKNGYPKDKPRKPQTLKIKLSAIKKHFEINNIKTIDFTKFDNTFFENL